MVDILADLELTGTAGFQRMKAMARHRSHSIEFKRQIAQELLAGETFYGSPNATTSCAT